MKLLRKAFSGILLPILFILLSGEVIYSQNKNRIISEPEKKEIVAKAFSLLRENYIFPEKVSAVEKILMKKMVGGFYSKFSTADDFLINLNKDLESLINDRHVNIFFDPVRVRQIQAAAKAPATSKPVFTPEFIARAVHENFMIRRAERLEENVGYLKLDLFVDIDLSAPTLVAAMDFLSNSAAVIIDLRKNGGGNANTVNFLESYFLANSTHISGFTSRLSKTTTEIYITPDTRIKKFPENVPLYILVSKRTSSAAEAFAYDLQAFKRAVIIGDTTNGEANPGYAFVVNSEMWMMIPTSLNVNAITKTNWQGIGVVPDVRIPADKALDAAQAAAYKLLRENAKSPEMQNRYEWLFTALDSKIHPVKLVDSELMPFTGKYANNRSISLVGESLYYEREGAGEKKKLVPLSKELFALDGVPFFRVKFIRDEKGIVTALEGVYDDGSRELSKKFN